MNLWNGILGFFTRSLLSSTDTDTTNGDREKSDADTEKLTGKVIKQSRANIQTAVVNNGELSAVLEAVVSGVVGETVNVQSRTKIDGVDEKIEEYLEEAKEKANFDLKGRLHFDGFLRAVERFYYMYGGVIVRKHLNKNWWMPIRFEIISVAMIDPNMVVNDKNWINGFKFDKYGRITHIKLYDNEDRLKSSEVSMDDLLYFSSMWISPSQVTAVSKLQPAYKMAKDLNSYADTELKSAENRANAGVYWATKLFDPIAKVLTTLKASADGKTDLSKTREAINKMQEKGVKSKGSTAIPYDDKIYTVDHKSDTVYDALVNNIKKSISSALGFGAQLIFRDVEKVNYSSAKYNNGLDNIKLSIEFDDLKENIIIPILRDMVKHGAERIGLKDFNQSPRKYQKFEILRTVYNDIEPLKTATADGKKLELKTTSLKEIIGKKGGDWMKTIDDNLDVEEYEEKQRKKRKLKEEQEDA